MWVRQKDVEKGEMGMEGGKEVKWRRRRRLQGDRGNG